MHTISIQYILETTTYTFLPEAHTLIVEIAHTLMCMQCSLIKMPWVADLTTENMEVGINSEERLTETQYNGEGETCHNIP